MGQRLHGSAKTKHAVGAVWDQLKTVLKWRKRTTVKEFQEATKTATLNFPQ
jgi:hypothetical protein